MALDLGRAVTLAIEHNPALAAAEEKRREVAGGVQEVKADAFPQVDATASYALSRNPSLLNSPDFADLLDQFPGGDFTPSEQRLYSAGVAVQQPVFTFGKIGAAIDLAHLVVDATEAQIESARLDVGLDAARAFYDLLAAREGLAVGRVQERVRREALEVVRARYDIGDATRLELLRAQAALAEVTPTVARLEGDVQLAATRLRRVLGLAPGTALDIAAPELPHLPPPTLPGDAAPAAGPAAPGPPLAVLPEAPPLPDLIATAVERRPELADLDLQQKALVKRQVVTHAEGKPQVELNGFYGRQVRLIENIDRPLFDDYSLSLGVSWSLFDGGRRKGRIAQLESQRRQLALAQEDLLAAIRQEVEEAATAYRTARARWQAAETAAAAAREASRVARESYQEGVALQTDWLDAQRQETETEIQAVDAYYDARRETARLARALGAFPGDGLPATGAAAVGAPAGPEETRR